MLRETSTYYLLVSQARFIQLIKLLQELPHDDRRIKPMLIFEKSSKAAIHNGEILKKFDFNIQDTIQAQTPSQVSFGSEF